MKNLFLTILCSFLSINAFAQNNGEYYTLKSALADPLKVKTLILRPSYEEDKLTALPKEIRKLKNLEYLNCTGNSLKTLPKELVECKKLKDLNISYNQITELPKEIGSLNLESFSCVNNQITELPKEIGNWTNLHSFDCSKNKITVLPKEIGNWTNLDNFNCNWNNITVLPKEMKNCIKLRALYTRGNLIESFAEFTTWVNLKKLQYAATDKSKNFQIKDTLSKLFPNTDVSGDWD